MASIVTELITPLMPGAGPPPTSRASLPVITVFTMQVPQHQLGLMNRICAMYRRNGLLSRCKDVQKGSDLERVALQDQIRRPFHAQPQIGLLGGMIVPLHIKP